MDYELGEVCRSARATVWACACRVRTRVCVYVWCDVIKDVRASRRKQMILISRTYIGIKLIIAVFTRFPLHCQINVQTEGTFTANMST